MTFKLLRMSFNIKDDMNATLVTYSVTFMVSQAVVYCPWKGWQ